MTLSVRECVEADEAAVEFLPAPEPGLRRKLFGITHAGVLVQTSHLTLCAEQLPQPPTPEASEGHEDAASSPSHLTLAGFASFDDQMPTELAQWPEVREYLKKRLQFGKPHGCVLLAAFRHDPAVCSERELLVVLLHRLFLLRPEVGGVVLAVHVGVDIEELGLFAQIFSYYDAVALSTGGLVRFFRVIRPDYTPGIFVRRPLSTESESEQLQTMVKHHEAQRRPSGTSWFDAAVAPGHALANQDEHRVCLVAQSVDSEQPVGLLACTDSIDTDRVDAYARLFSDLYRKANPLPSTVSASASEIAEAPEPLPPAGATPTVAPAPPPTPATRPPVRTLARSNGGPPNIILLGPPGAGKGTQSKRLVQEFGVVHVCAGRLLIQACDDGSAKAEEVKRCLEAGELVPDEIVHDLVLNRLMQADCKARGWLLEGFPRTEIQARVLVAHGVKPDMVAVLELSDDDVSHRNLEGEAVAKVETPSTLVSRRLALYREHREAVRQNFVKISTVVHIDAAKSRDTITKKLVWDVYRARGSRGPLRLRNPPRLIITGPPASGKGTQCELLVQALHVVHLSTGDMLRQAIRDASTLGQKAQHYMDEGQLVPDDLIVDVVLERLAQPDCQARGWLLDGFPRTAVQAQALLAARGGESSPKTTPDCVLVLDVPDDEVVKRIAGRRVDPLTGKTYHVNFNPPPAEVADRVIQRSDDTEETVRTRLEQFHAHSDAVVTALGGVCEVVRADGTRAVDQVAEQLLASAEYCLLRNNAAVVSLFSMETAFQTRASLFLADAFEHFKDKDCLLLCFPERCGRPALTSGFRLVHGDPTISTIARLKLQEKEKAAVATGSRKVKGGKPSGNEVFVLYAFHRDELPFLVNFVLELNDADEGQQVREAAPVIVKGLGVKGFGRTVRAWTGKCFEMLGFSGRKKKKPKQKEQPRTRAVTSDSTDLVSGGDAVAPEDETNRHTLH
ncbi:hypothetical protein BBJ28_00003587 [Nothophytophthora sp. Chile5]|nr:hypothetical protein BBJ28_00003587 [Nothophytophthora sp. Chile5]